MGDGRYYTVFQFVNVTAVLVLIMLMTVNLVANCYYQKNTRKSRQLIGIYILLYVGVLFRFISEVITKLIWAQMLLDMSRLLLTVVWVLLGIALALLLIEINLGEHLVAGSLLVVRQKIYFIIALGSFILSVTLMGVLWHHDLWSKYWYLAQYGALGLMLHQLLGITVSYSISAQLFTKSKDMILDYVFIVDKKDNLIYKNKHSEIERFFKPIKKINKDTIGAIFNQSVEYQRLNNKDYILYPSNEKTYFSYSYKPLMRKNRFTGAIFTFRDVTGLVKLIEKLNKDQIASNKVNQELKAYAKVVYDIEKEKEIEALLKEIAVNQEEGMKALKDEMTQLETYSGDEFDRWVHQMIENTKKSLLDVRESVNAFRAYYGGEND